MPASPTTNLTRASRTAKFNHLNLSLPVVHFNTSNPKGSATPDLLLLLLLLPPPPPLHRLLLQSTAQHGIAQRNTKASRPTGTRNTRKEASPFPTTPISTQKEAASQSNFHPAAVAPGRFFSCLCSPPPLSLASPPRRTREKIQEVFFPFQSFDLSSSLLLSSQRTYTVLQPFWPFEVVSRLQGQSQP